MRDLIVERLAHPPPLEELLTADDLEKQREASQAVPQARRRAAARGESRAGPTVVFTQRTAHLAAHAGQVSFPGGSSDAADASPEGTALREAEEEVGIAPHRVEVLGRLPEYLTSTGFSVTPVVGWAEPPS